MNSLDLTDEIKEIFSRSRYEMCGSQQAQIDCRRSDCINYDGGGKCINVSPAITLNDNGTFVCWTHQKVLFT